jgi:hypothetical protein
MGALEPIAGVGVGIRSDYAEPGPTTAACFGTQPNGPPLFGTDVAANDR